MNDPLNDYIKEFQGDFEAAKLKVRAQMAESENARLKAKLELLKRKFFKIGRQLKTIAEAALWREEVLEVAEWMNCNTHWPNGKFFPSAESIDEISGVGLPPFCGPGSS